MWPFKRTAEVPSYGSLGLVKVKGRIMQNNTLKLIAATLLFLAWMLVIVGKHFWPDLQIEAIQQAIGLALTGLGIYHVTSNQSNSDS